MSPEIRLTEEEAFKFLLGINCPQDCEGKIQTLETPTEMKASCYRCGTQIDLATVKVVYETKEDQK